MCRCTGWQTITEAAVGLGELTAPDRDADAVTRASFRAVIEGGSAQSVGATVVAGSAGFAADTAPEGARVVVPDGDGGWTVAATLAEARMASGKVQGRRSTVVAEPPLEVPDGDWAVRLATSWIEPAYLETDASWCVPGGEPATPLANGGAFGGKVGASDENDVAKVARVGRPPGRAGAGAVQPGGRGAARRQAASHRRGLRADGSGRVLVGWSGGADVAPVIERIVSVLPDVDVEVVPVLGPPPRRSCAAPDGQRRRCWQWRSPKPGPTR